MSLFQHTKVLIDTSHDTGHSGLTCTRTAEEHQVIGDLGNLQPLCLTLFLHLNEVGQCTHLFLHLSETDEVIEFLIRISLQGFIHDHGFLFRDRVGLFLRSGVGTICRLLLIYIKGECPH